MKRPVNKRIIEALNNNDSIIVNAANELGCSRQTLRKWIDNDPDLIDAEKEAIESLKDKVEYQLLKNIRAGKEASLIWYTKTQMRSRNYLDRIEQDTNVNINQISIQYVVPIESKEQLPEQLQQNLPEESNLITIKIDDTTNETTNK